MGGQTNQTSSVNFYLSILIRTDKRLVTQLTASITTTSITTTSITTDVGGLNVRANSKDLGFICFGFGLQVVASTTLVLLQEELFGEESRDEISLSMHPSE